MNLDELETLIAANPELREHAYYLHTLIRPSVRIRINQERPTGVQSYFGGSPMVPADFAWPEHDVGLYYFLGQINFADIENRPAELPESGVLSLFYADYNPQSDNDGDIFWRDEGYVKAWYFEDLSQLVPMQAPHGRSVKAKSITLAGELDIPRHVDMLADCPFDPEVLEDALKVEGEFPGPDASIESLATDYLLGYPSYYSLAYDPTPGPEWVSLLTLHSHDAFEWCWHDGDKLMVFIERDKLQARDFSVLACDAG